MVASPESPFYSTIYFAADLVTLTGVNYLIRTEVLAIKNKPPNKDDPTVRIFGPGDHHSWTEEKAYYWCPNHVMSAR